MSTRSERILQALQAVKGLQHIDLENESDHHSGPPGRETHFKLLLVTDSFKGLNRLDRQRLIYDLLKTEMDSGLHALAMRLLTIEEWAKSQAEFASPNCQTKPKVF